MEIRASSVITIALDYMTSLGTTVDIYFKAALSNDEKTALDAIVNAHVPTPLPDQASLVKLDEPKDDDGRPCMRQVITEPEFHYSPRSFDFYTSKHESLYNRSHYCGASGNDATIDGSPDLGDATLKFYNSSNTELTQGAEESDADFQKRLREEFNKASNKQQVYTIKADGGYQRVTKTTVSKKLPKANVDDPRLGGFVDDYSYVEGVLKDPANKGIVTRMYDEYKRQIDASNLSAARKAELKKKTEEEVLDNFLKAQKQVFAITKAEVEGKVDPITKNKAWDKGGSNKNNIYRKTAKDIADPGVSGGCEFPYGQDFNEFEAADSIFLKGLWNERGKGQI